MCLYGLGSTIRKRSRSETKVSWPGCDQSVNCSAEIYLHAIHPHSMEGKTAMWKSCSVGWCKFTFFTFQDEQKQNIKQWYNRTAMDHPLRLFPPTKILDVAWFCRRDGLMQCYCFYLHHIPSRIFGPRHGDIIDHLRVCRSLRLLRWLVSKSCCDECMLCLPALLIITFFSIWC